MKINNNNLKININQKFLDFYSKINIIKFNIVIFIKILKYIYYGHFIIISFTRIICYF